MAGLLQVIQGPDQGKTFAVPDADVVMVGRSRALEARLTDPYVSRVHCQIHFEETAACVTDFESAGGTFVNDQRVTRQFLNSGDAIRIGSTVLQYLRAGDIAEQKTLPPQTSTMPATATEDDLSKFIGRTIAHYQIGQVLAKGQTGIVFHARNVKNDVPVALKILWPQVMEKEEQKKRFVRAMKTALPLRHPNLVALLGAGRSLGHCWLAMEYVEGESLVQVVQRLGTLGMLDWRNALRVAVHVGRALDFAHRHQIVHRNVTPMNILIQAGTKEAKLGDLMLAKALEGNLAFAITGRGELLGPVPYLSPEATYGTEKIDARSDFYSLGATVYALLTGRQPFDGKTLSEIIHQIRNVEPVKPKKYQLAIPDLLEGVVLKMLDKRPENRFQQSGEMLAELERVAKFQGMII